VRHFYATVIVADSKMIWDDPWVLLAMQKGGTTIPPPPTPLAPGQRFVCVQVHNVDLTTWIDLVGTRWTSEELMKRLAGAWIPCLFADGEMVATCVLRYKDKIWILETLRARKGFGTPLLREVIPWLYKTEGGPFVLGYTWELSVPGLVGAWLKGWLGSATALQYGWSLRTIPDGPSCNFCPSKWEPIGPRLTLPTLFQDASGHAVISDSGLGDGWGYVIRYNGTPDWSGAAKKGGWRSLWMRSSLRPGSGWSWTGEFVVVGLLNYRGGKMPALDWITAEIASP
jgi:hypothetical protein